ncbi:hypothetical protein HCN51_27275 [Nonomuraea sp. FMUSA5-5]|uniref:Uncharacterized protein n=1 Tax=Nonomuraea composti TaxID=2720023 RepID=A0ABX1BBF4_9ACTN|nr:hypothetical protein [Nonomuraea sp. FMUSA5-5]NJP93106.1 hypothetical protein [Nonomuraea sp. FMUSA5-5]
MGGSPPARSDGLDRTSRQYAAHRGHLSTEQARVLGPAGLSARTGSRYAAAWRRSRQ